MLLGKDGGNNPNKEFNVHDIGISNETAGTLKKEYD